MRPYRRFEVDRGKRNDAQAGTRTVLVAALCLVIGFGLGGLWHSRRAQRSALPAEAEAPGPEATIRSAGARSVPPNLAAPAQLKSDPAIVAEVKRRIPNFAALPLEEGSWVLREAALK